MRLQTALFGLPPARTRQVRVRRGLSVRMRDGVILRADHYAPRLPGPLPTVLVRTPYGRGGPLGPAAVAVAGQGFHVLVQSCRGTADAGGRFDPLVQEQPDGLDTIDWLRRQPWYGGTFAMFGPSYLGYTQWAVAADAGPDLRALVTIVTASSFRDSTYAGGGFSLDSVLTWSTILAGQRQPLAATLADLARGQPRLKRGLAHPVLGEADTVALGAAVPYFQEWLRETADAPYWLERSHDHRLAEVTAPVLMIGGWYDIFLPWQLADHATLTAAGHRPTLHIGSWHHGSIGLFRAQVREGVRFLRAHLYDEKDLLPDSPVRVQVGGTREWVNLPEWPPPATEQAWYLADGGRLTAEPRPDTPAVIGRFRYDPRHPTPAVGGPRLNGWVAGPRDNRRLEARPDVVTFTGDPLGAPMEIRGPVHATIRMRSTLPAFDVFVRLCDVGPDGRSTNVCDGLIRVADGRDEVAVAMWPSVYRFAAGNRLRVQVSGGAHPRWSRNPGTGAPLAEGGPLLASDREIFTGSAVHLHRS